MADASAGRLLLCLKCRGAGHLVKDCIASQWHNPEELQPLTSERRPPDKRFEVLDQTACVSADLCDRCSCLDVPGLLTRELHWKSYIEIGELVDQDRAPFTDLGKVGTIPYFLDCQLCRCLFAITPGPYSEDQTVVAFPAWTIFRLEGSIKIDSSEKEKYAKCLIVTLRPCAPTFRKVEFADAVTRGDALCILEGQRLSSDTALNARQFRSDGVNVALIKDWISSCEERHPLTCTPQYTEKLRGMRLIDCSNSAIHRVVPYPSKTCDYLALSYVWGTVKKQSFTSGPIAVGTLPRTIEDAIVLTRGLGLTYLWCDFVCVDQFDEEDKRRQIGMMAQIYQGAYATIIAMSGRSADSGLPQVRHKASEASQLRCKVNGTELVTLMPTLTHLIWSSPWAQRSWTFQEALLSRRCLYLTDWQLHFECNAMSCCETLEERRSWVHCTTRTEIPLPYQTKDIGTGCLRFTASDFNLGSYGSSVNLYSYRSMSDTRDAINAFSGMLDDWQSRCGLMFHYGLPAKYFQWGLLWTAQQAVTRRTGFPSWSWAGWLGPLKPRLPIKLFDTDPLQTYLSVYRTHQNKFELLFESRGASLLTRVDKVHDSDPFEIGGDEDVDQFVRDRWLRKNFGDSHAIAVEGIMLTIKPKVNPIDFIDEDLPRYSNGLTFHQLNLEGHTCILAWHGPDVSMHAKLDMEGECLVVTREVSRGWVHHWLLLLDVHDSVATRVTTVRLSVLRSDLHALSALSPRKERIWIM